MFSYTGLSEKVCEILINKYHIYLLKSGRISVAGVNTKNVKYLAQSIKAAILEAGEKWLYIGNIKIMLIIIFPWII